MGDDITDPKRFGVFKMNSAKELENKILQILKNHDDETQKINRYYGQWFVDRLEEQTSKKITDLLTQEGE